MRQIFVFIVWECGSQNPNRNPNRNRNRNRNPNPNRLIQRGLCRNRLIGHRHDAKTCGE